MLDFSNKKKILFIISNPILSHAQFENEAVDKLSSFCF